MSASSDLPPLIKMASISGFTAFTNMATNGIATNQIKQYKIEKEHITSKYALIEPTSYCAFWRHTGGFSFRNGLMYLA